MSETNGRINYNRLVSDIDFASAFEGTRFEAYTDSDSEGGIGSVLGGWVGAAVGRFVGMALGQVAQELVIDELFGSTDDGDGDEGDSNVSEESTAADEQSEESDESTAEGDKPAEADAE